MTKASARFSSSTAASSPRRLSISTTLSSRFNIP